MKKTRFYALLMAVAMVFSLGVLASCGDDDPDPTPNNPNTPSTPSTSAKSCTFYYIEAYAPEDFDNVDMKLSFVQNDAADNYQPISRDAFGSINSIANEEIRKAVKVGVDAIGALHEKEGTDIFTLYRTTQVSVNTFPTVFNIKYQFAPKEGVTAEKINFGYYTAYVAIDNNGKSTILSGDGRYGQGIKMEKFDAFFATVKTRMSRTLNLTKENGSIMVTPKK